MLRAVGSVLSLLPFFIKKIPTLATTPQVNRVVRTTGKPVATGGTSPAGRQEHLSRKQACKQLSRPGADSLLLRKRRLTVSRHVLVLFVWVYFCLRSAGSLTDMTG